MIITPERRGREISETLILILLVLIVSLSFFFSFLGFFSSPLLLCKSAQWIFTLILSSLSLFPLYFLSTVGVGIYPFKFVSPHNSRCFLIGDICTLSDVRVRALCCELSGALDSAPSSSSVSQVASDAPQCEWRGTRHTPPLQMNRDTRSLHFCHEEHSECLAKPSVRTLQNCPDTWPLALGIVRTALWWCSGHFCLLCHLLLPHAYCYRVECEVNTKTALYICSQWDNAAPGLAACVYGDPATNQRPIQGVFLLLAQCSWNLQWLHRSTVQEVK